MGKIHPLKHPLRIMLIKIELIVTYNYKKQEYN